MSRSVAVGVTMAYGLGTSAWVYARDHFSTPGNASCAVVDLCHLATGVGSSDGTCCSPACSWPWRVHRVTVLLLVPLVALYAMRLGPRPIESGTTLDEGGAGGAIARLREACRQAVSVPQLRYAGTFLVPSLVVLDILLLLNQVKFGDPLTFNPSAAARVSPRDRGLVSMAISSARAVACFCFRLRRARSVGSAGAVAPTPDLAALILAIAGAQLLLFSKFGYWHGGWSYGHGTCCWS